MAASLTYRDALARIPFLAEVPGALDLQLVLNNLSGEDYDHPGVGQAGRFFAARLPQVDRSAMLVMSLTF